jgi:protein-S-isoprenylcysteine O-methyltransferase Ste14
VSDIASAFARKRVSLGFVLGFVVLALAKPTAATLTVGAAVAATGELLRLWAAGHLHKSREVTMSGPYRWFAHPLYVGSSIIGGGLAIASASVIAAVVIAAYLIVMLTAAIQSEEAHLRRLFGDRYAEYRRGAAARSSGGGRRFNIRQAIANREHRTLGGLLIALLLLVLKATYNGSFWRAAAGR